MMKTGFMALSIFVSLVVSTSSWATQSCITQDSMGGTSPTVLPQSDGVEITLLDDLTITLSKDLETLDGTVPAGSYVGIRSPWNPDLVRADVSDYVDNNEGSTLNLTFENNLLVSIYVFAKWDSSPGWTVLRSQCARR